MRRNVQVDGHARMESERENGNVCALCEKRVSTGRSPSLKLKTRSKAWIPLIHAFKVNTLLRHHGFRIMIR